MAEVLRLPANDWKIPGKEGFRLLKSRFLGLLNPSAEPIIPVLKSIVEQPTVVEPVAAVVSEALPEDQESELTTESEDLFAEERGYLQRWTEKHPNPFSLRSRVGQTAPLGRNRIAIRESGQMIEIDESKKVSLVSKDVKKPLGVTIYDLSRKDLE